MFGRSGEDSGRLRPQFSLFAAVAAPVFHSIIVPFASDQRLLDNFGCCSPVWSPSSHFGAFSPSVPQMHPCFRPFYSNKIFNTLGMRNLKKKSIRPCCGFSKNNPAVLMSPVWCREQAVRKHPARVQHPGPSQRKTGGAERSGGLEVTLLEVSKSPFGALPICSTWCSFPHWFRSLTHPLCFSSYSFPPNTLRSSNKVVRLFLFFVSWRSEERPRQAFS